MQRTRDALRKAWQGITKSLPGRAWRHHHTCNSLISCFLYLSAFSTACSQNCRLETFLERAKDCWTLDSIITIHSPKIMICLRHYPTWWTTEVFTWSFYFRYYHYLRHCNVMGRWCMNITNHHCLYAWTHSSYYNTFHVEQFVRYIE